LHEKIGRTVEHQVTTKNREELARHNGKERRDTTAVENAVKTI